ncbi:hypothetical protein SK128_006815 [Halocaridina rubra]|uniref:Uncharacterized protein n=1 Tax=Halocaridina rubra TaxID=373956 RepID=A0AAN9A9Q5_HALRR
MQRSATSLSSSRLVSEPSDEDSFYAPVSLGTSTRTSTSQSMSSVKSTVTIDSSSFSCCSPSSEPSEHSESSTQLDSTPSSNSGSYDSCIVYR